MRRSRQQWCASFGAGAEIVIQGDFRHAEPRLMSGLHDALVRVGAISPDHILRYTGRYRHAHGGPVQACMRKWLRRATAEQRRRFSPIGAERARQVFEFLLRHGGAGTQSFHARFVVVDAIDLISPWLYDAHLTKVDGRCGLTRMKAEQAVQQLRNRDTIIVQGVLDASLCHAAVQPENDVCQRDEVLEVQPSENEPMGLVGLLVRLLFCIQRVIVLIERSSAWMDRRFKHSTVQAPPAVLRALLLAFLGRYAFLFASRLIRTFRWGLNGSLSPAKFMRSDRAVVVHSAECTF
jgi:hypothetical protein